ncbi:MAG: hypothetical protein EXR73_13585 [Myxococcales bacterium]|nr:hypothetical protein [Myxococcales bacterium]
MKRALRRSLLVAALVVFSACEPDCPEGTPVIVLDTRGAPAGDALLTIGSQGGFHLGLDLQTAGLCGDRLALSYALTELATGLVLSAGDRDVEQQDGFADLDTVVVVCPVAPEVVAVDRLLHVRLTATDPHGATASTGLEVTARCPTAPDALWNTCQRICDGRTP